MWLFPMVHHCRRASTFHSLGRRWNAYTRKPTFVPRSVLVLFNRNDRDKIERERVQTKINCNCDSFNFTLPKVFCVDFTCAVNTFIRMTVTLATSTDCNISYSIEIWFQHLRVTKHFITKCIQTIQWDSDIGGCHPILNICAQRQGNTNKQAKNINNDWKVIFDAVAATAMADTTIRNKSSSSNNKNGNDNKLNMFEMN